MLQKNMDLRHAAILVSSLDRKTADSLLDALPSSKAVELRNAIMSLTEVDPIEQQSIIREFLDGEMGQLPLASPPEMPPAILESGVNESPAPDEKEPEQVPLHRCNLSRLSQLLQHEQPLTIAACLSRLSSTQAVTVVQNLPRDIRGVVLKRTAELQDADPESLAEIERELSHLLQQDVDHQTRLSNGVARLQAMLHHLDSSDRQMLVNDLAKHDGKMATRLTHLTSSGTRQYPERTPPSITQPANSTSSLGLEFRDLRLANRETLTEIFRRSDFETTVLAIAGATETVADELLERLPNSIARRIRQRLANPGPIRLRDISLAQKSMVRLAEQLHLQGVVSITLPDHHFVASA